MNKTGILMTGFVTFVIVILLGGLVMYWFAGSLNFFGEQGFHGDPDYFFSGALASAFLIAPCITALVFRICQYRKPAKIMLICAMICWLFFLGVLPAVHTVQQKIRDSASPAEIAKRAIDRTDKKMKKEGKVPDSAEYARCTGSGLWIFEGTATRLDAAKEKEVVECAAELIMEKKELSPVFSDYGWRSVYNGKDLFYYAMILFYQDGSYVMMYDMELERWQELGLNDPPKNEGTKDASL